MSNEDEPNPNKIGGLGGLFGNPFSPSPAPPLTEEMITRAVANGLARAASISSETDRDLWLRLFTGPAPFVTRVGTIPHAGGITRLVFGDQYDDAAPTQYRAAVTMTDFNAYELWKLLGRLPGVQHSKEQEEKYAAEQAATQGSADGGE